MEKVNYDLILENLVNNLDYQPKLLLHSCCGPCSSYVITYLKDYFDITILYYNPNIEPKEEYEKRKKEQIKLIEALNLSNLHFLDCDYENDVYHEKVKGHEKDKEGGSRCHLCYELRLNRCAELASSLGFEYFGTTLSVSPYKNATALNNIGADLAQKYPVKWLYSDFKKKDGYKKSILLSKEYDLYRQNYCGCLYSKRDE